MIWSDSGELVAIVGESSFYILQFNRWGLGVAQMVAGSLKIWAIRS